MILSSLVFPGLTFGAPLDKNIEIVLFISLWAYITIFKVKKQDNDYREYWPLVFPDDYNG